MLMVRFGKKVVMNTPLSNVKGKSSNAIQSVYSTDSRRTSESSDSKYRNRRSDRVYAVPRVSLSNNSNSDTVVDKINSLNKRSAILDKMISLHFPKSMDGIINITDLKRTFEQENDNMEQILLENNKFYSITNNFHHSNINEKNEVLNEIENSFVGYDPNPLILKFINQKKYEFLSKI